MADVIALPGCTVPDVPAEPAPPCEYAKYLRSLADLIDDGQVKPNGLVAIVSSVDNIYVQRLGLDVLQTLGLLDMASRAVA